MKRLLLCILLLLSVCTGCVKQAQEPLLSPEVTVTETPSPAPTPTPEPTPTPDPVALRENEINAYIQSLTLEEKAAAVFVVKASDMGQLPVGGVILFAGDIRTEDQVKADIAKWKSESSLPLWVCADEEGGMVSRLDKLPSVTVVKSAKSYNGDADAVYSAYQGIGKSMSELGFNVNFAPCADVLTNPDNKVIGNRSFSNDPEIAASCVVQACKALEESNILAVPKHFPGHGDSSGDSHYGSVSLNHDMTRLINVDFAPFLEAIYNGGAQAILAGHIALPEITGNEIPATLNTDIIDSLLRKELRFDGIVFTDALDMRAITDNYSAGEGAVMALLAGCDVLLMPENLVDAHAGIIDAVQSGRLPESRLDEAIFRQLKIKMES